MSAWDDDNYGDGWWNQGDSNTSSWNSLLDPSNTGWGNLGTGTYNYQGSIDNLGNLFNPNYNADQPVDNLSDPNAWNNYQNTNDWSNDNNMFDGVSNDQATDAANYLNYSNGSFGLGSSGLTTPQPGNGNQFAVNYGLPGAGGGGQNLITRILQNPNGGGNPNANNGYDLLRMLASNIAGNRNDAANRQAQEQLQGQRDPYLQNYYKMQYDMLNNPGKRFMTPGQHEAMDYAIEQGRRTNASQGRTAQDPWMASKLTMDYENKARQQQIDNVERRLHESGTSALLAQLMSNNATNKNNTLQDLLATGGNIATNTGWMDDQTGGNNSNLLSLAILSGLFGGG